MVIADTERRQLLESFGSAPAVLGATLRAFPRKMWVYKNSTNPQSIHDIVWQLAHNEVTEYIYCRRFIADSDPSPLAIDLPGIPGNLECFYQNIKEAMGIIRALRLATYRFLKTSPESAWHFPIQLPSHVRLTLHQWLQIRERDIPDQVQKMDRIYIAWLGTNVKAPRTSARTNTSSVRIPAEAI